MIRLAFRCVVATVVLSAFWACSPAYANHYILCQEQKCEIVEAPGEIPDDPNGSAKAKWSVDQVYSNANGAIQYIVLSQDGVQECDGLSVISVHDGATHGIVWTDLPRVTSDRRFLIATRGFERLGILSPNAVVFDGFLGTREGVIRVCDTEYHYAALPTDGVTALNASGSAVRNVATNLAGYSRSVTAGQAASIDLRFHDGLTGSWYDPATNGQGFEIEIEWDWANWDVGWLVMVSWFTYGDSAAQGPEGQRWYTILGRAYRDGTPTAPLDIYRNVGGNFNAGPITAGQKVGSASLTFAGCDHGTLEYAFTDGSGRSGSIPLTRMTKNVSCPGQHVDNSDFALSGNWYDPATSGQGITVEINPVSGAAFLAWYTYAPGGVGAGPAGQRWYTAQGPYIAGQRSVPMTIYETTGGLFAAATPSPHSSSIGSATLAFKSCTEATLTYDFAGGSSAGATGTIVLRRLFGYCPI